MLDRKIGDWVFVTGIAWVWGRIYLLPAHRRMALIDAGNSMFWATSKDIAAEPPPGYPRLLRERPR